MKAQQRTIEHFGEETNRNKLFLCLNRPSAATKILDLLCKLQPNGLAVKIMRAQSNVVNIWFASCSKYFSLFLVSLLLLVLLWISRLLNSIYTHGVCVPSLFFFKLFDNCRMALFHLNVRIFRFYSPRMNWHCPYVLNMISCVCVSVCCTLIKLKKKRINFFLTNHKHRSLQLFSAEKDAGAQTAGQEWEK